MLSLAITAALGCSTTAKKNVRHVGALPSVESPIAEPAVDAGTSPLPDDDAGEDTRPNVVLIVVDTLRADHLGSYGYDLDTSPVIDTLAGDSVTFMQAYATAPWTLPSVASILTGQYPETLGIKNSDVKLEKRFLTLTELFQRNGYATGAVVSHIFLKPKFGIDQGFDVFDFEEAGRGRSHISSPAVTQKAIELIERYSGKPFFLFVHYFDPHYNYRMHSILPPDPGYGGRLREGMSIHEMRKMAAAGELDDNDKKYIRALYDSEVRFTDAHVGRLLDVLKQRGLYDETLVVFTSDHGEDLCDRPSNWIGHTKTLNEEVVRVPLLIKPPRLRSGRKERRAHSLIDLMPTIATLAGIEVPAGYSMDGVAIDLENTENTPRGVFAATWRWAKLQTLVSGDWKLLMNRKTGAVQLFNLKSDPLEKIDVANDNEDLCKKMIEEIEKKLKKHERPASHIERSNQAPGLTKEERKKLESLGYIE